MPPYPIREGAESHALSADESLQARSKSPAQDPKSSARTRIIRGGRVGRDGGACFGAGEHETGGIAAHVILNLRAGVYVASAVRSTGTRNASEGRGSKIRKRRTRWPHIRVGVSQSNTCLRIRRTRGYVSVAKL